MHGKRFLALEKEQNLANSKWNVYGTTLEEREKNLSHGNRQMTIFDFIMGAEERKEI